jgi:hypothetical protein
MPQPNFVPVSLRFAQDPEEWLVGIGRDVHRAAVHVDRCHRHRSSHEGLPNCGRVCQARPPSLDAAGGDMFERNRDSSLLTKRLTSWRRPRSVLPERFEPIGRQVRVPRRVDDVRCPRSCWMALVSCASLASLHQVARRSICGRTGNSRARRGAGAPDDYPHAGVGQRPTGSIVNTRTAEVNRPSPIAALPSRKCSISGKNSPTIATVTRLRVVAADRPIAVNGKVTLSVPNPQALRPYTVEGGDDWHWRPGAGR